MRTFLIRKNRHYSYGPKWQPLILSGGLLLLSPFFLIVSMHWLYLIIALIIIFTWTLIIENKKKEELGVSVLFDKSCLYELTSNIGQVNKLLGRSEGLHHSQSARFGWRCVGSQVELLAYCYVNGIREEKVLGLVDVGQWVGLKLSISKDYYRFTVTRADKMKVSVLYISKKSENINWRVQFSRLFTYRLYPYFGGIISAPHDIKIQVKNKVK